jgi:ribonuclease P protein component
VGKAVQRNRAKRRLRAALQPYLEKIRPGWELVLIARQPLAGATFHQTQAALRSLLQRAHLLIEAHDD